MLAQFSAFCISLLLLTSCKCQVSDPYQTNRNRRHYQPYKVPLELLQLAKVKSQARGRHRTIHRHSLVSLEVKVSYAKTGQTIYEGEINYDPGQGGISSYGVLSILTDGVGIGGSKTIVIPPAPEVTCSRRICRYQVDKDKYMTYVRSRGPIQWEGKILDICDRKGLKISSGRWPLLSMPRGCS